MPWIPEDGYAVQYVQTIIEDCTSTNYFGTTKTRRNTDWCIDTKYPYKRLTYPSTSPAGGTGQPLFGEENTDNCPGPWCQVSMEDTPETPLDQGSVDLFLDVSQTHHFKTYLMFRPSNNDSDKESLWVPLLDVTWGWSAFAHRIVDKNDVVPCEKAYQFTGSPPSKSGCAQRMNPDFPEWDCNVLKNDL